MQTARTKLSDETPQETDELNDVYRDMCAIPMHPDLREKIVPRIEAILGSAEDATPKGAKAKAAKSKHKPDKKLDDMVSKILRQNTKARVGLNDGLIIPGEYFPLGTPVRTVRRSAADRSPLSGTVRVIVVLVNFKDKSMTAAHNKQHFKDLFFSTGVLPNGSVKEYYTEVTNGIITIAGDVVGPFKLSQNMSYYAHGDSGTGGTFPNARTMAQEAAQLANPSVNFAPYDNDGNGYVDAFIVIHAGSGAEQTGSVNDIWSHKWNLPAEFNADSTKIYPYLTVPEDSRIGVCCHELGHLLFGFPDLYDTDGSSEGIGNWCLMAGGSWNGNGDIPAHPSAWCKVNQGWASTIVQTSNSDVSIKDVKTSHSVYRLWKDGTGGSEYFLVENRQKKLYDKKLPGDGLLIWHIDDSISSNTNEVHPKVKLVQADGLNQMEAGTNRGDAGDSYPGGTNNKSFTDTSTPNSKSYAGTKTCVGVTNIGPSGPTMAARLTVKCAIIKAAKEKEFSKEFQKELQKELQIDKNVAKEIDTKTLGKEADKPATDKSAGFDKGTDKFGDKTNEGGLPGLPGGGTVGGGGMPAGSSPFIGSNLRPDLSQGALLSENDLSNIQGEMQAGNVHAKRLFDSKLPEA